MKKSTSIRMLLRSPVKTAVTLLLIAAASFLFLYNLLDYAMTKREYDRTYGNYHGYVTIQHPEDKLAESDALFFLSDPAGNPAYSDNLPYAPYHMADLEKEAMEAISALPYVTRAETRYMTGGLADFPRYHTVSSLASYEAYLNTNRIVLEATFDKIDLDFSKVNIDLIGPKGIDVTLRLKGVKVLAGNEEDLKQSIPYVEKKTLYVKGNVVSPLRADNRPRYYWIQHRGAYAKNWVSSDLISGLIPGERYVFVLSVNPYSMNSMGMMEREQAERSPYTFIGDDSLYGVCDYITPLAGEPENYLETEKFAGIRQMMEIIETDKRTLDIHYVEDMQAIRRLQEGKLGLQRGRFLTPEDTAQRNPVCVIPEDMAKRQGLAPGDTLHLQLGDKLLEQNVSFGAVAYSTLRYAENWIDQDFTVVGVFTESGLDRLSEEDTFWAYAENAVFVPRSFLPETADTENHAYKPADVTFVIGDADSILPFRDEVLPELAEMGYEYIFFDGNWPAVREQLLQTESLSLIKLGAFGFSALLVLWLTVYLYILRKKKEYAVMRALGCPARQAQEALLSPLLILAIPAVLLGSIGSVIYTLSAAEQNAAEFAALGLTMDTAIPPLMVLAGFVGSLVMLLALAWAALRSIAAKPPLELLQGTGVRSHSRRQPSLLPESVGITVCAELPELPEPVYRPHTALRHTLRYVGKHLRRAPVKSLLAVLLALVLAFSMGFFTLLRSTYRDLYQNIEVHPRFQNGFTNNRALEVAKSGYVKDAYYEYINRGCESNFVEDTLILTSDLSRVTDAEVTWREDKGPEMFGENRGFVVISRDLAEALGYELGSRLEICTQSWFGFLRSSYPGLTEEELIDQVYHKFSHKFTVAGIAEEEGMRVYASIFSWEYFGSMFSDYVPLDLAEFTLVDYHKATEFRSWVFRLLTGRPGSFSMDTAEADRVYQTYRLLELLYPIAFTLALLLGGILPAGIILQSAKEASLLRVLGTTKRRTRAMLSLEQMILCLLGLLCAAVGLIGLKGAALQPVSGLLWLYAAAHFCLCILGTAVAAVSVTRRNVLELLQVKE